MNPKKEEALSIPWWNIIRGSLVMSTRMTFLGSLGIFSLAMTEGLEAAGLYLLYVPAIIAFFGSLILLCISVVICTNSFQWARRVVCLLAYVFAVIVLGPMILMPHFVLGMLLFVAATNDTWTWGGSQIAIFVVFSLVALYWSRGLYRFEKRNRWLGAIWEFANKYINNTKGARKNLKKLIDDFSEPPPFIPEAVKKRFRRS